MKIWQKKRLLFLIWMLESSKCWLPDFKSPLSKCCKHIGNCEGSAQFLGPNYHNQFFWEKNNWRKVKPHAWRTEMAGLSGHLMGQSVAHHYRLCKTRKLWYSYQRGMTHIQPWTALSSGWLRPALQSSEHNLISLFSCWPWEDTKLQPLKKFPYSALVRSRQSR